MAWQPDGGPGTCRLPCGSAQTIDIGDGNNNGVSHSVHRRDWPRFVLDQLRQSIDRNTHAVGAAAPKVCCMLHLCTSIRCNGAIGAKCTCCTSAPTRDLPKASDDANGQ